MLKFFSRMIILMVACVPFTQADESYELGAGDTISISVFGQSELSIKTTLDASGIFQFPYIGTVAAAGLSVNKLSTGITDRLKDGYLVDPQVFVTINQYRPYYLLGDVKRPGAYPFIPGITISEAIALAGGMNSNGLFALAIEPESIFVYENGDRDNTSVAALNSPVGVGDTIAVKQGSANYLLVGDVKRPGNYPFQEAITVRDAVAYAGGIDATAVIESIAVYKPSDPATQTWVDPSYTIQRGDTVEIIQARLQYFILGSVLSPGAFPLETGMTVQQAILRAGGIANSNQPAQYFVFSKDNAITKNQVSNTERLTNGDTLVVEQDDAQFYVLGKINSPGVYKLTPGLTIMDAIAMAGGLTATSSYTQSQDLKRISVFEKTNRSVAASAEVNTEIKAGDLIVIGKGMNL